MSGTYIGFDADEFTNWIQDFLNDVQMYKSASGERILILGSFANDKKCLGNSVFVTQNGKTFRQMEELGYGGSSSKHSRSYEDPMTQKHYRMFFEGGIYTRFEADSREVPLEDIYDEFEHFVGTDPVIHEGATFVPVPEVRVPEYLFRFEDGRLVYVDAVKYGYAYKHMRLFVGTPEGMIQKQITGFARYHDGGTTIIHTASGVLFSPTTFDENGAPLWSEDIEVSASDFFNRQADSAVELTRLDLTDEKNVALIQEFSLHTT